MPHREKDHKYVLPPVSRHNGDSNNRQPSKSNHGVSLPPIQDNNKITNGNNISQDDRTWQTNSNVGEQRSNTRQTGYDDERKHNDYNRKRRSRSRSKSAEKNRDRKSENRPRSKSPSRNRNRSAERSKKNDRRSRSRDQKKRDPSHSRRQSRSKSRGRSRRRSRSRESSRRRKTHESRRRSKSRHNVRHRNRSRDRRSRQRSKDRSSSRDKHITREQSKTRSKNYRHNKSRSRSRDRDEQGHKSHSKRDKYHHSFRSLSRDGDREYRHKTRSQTTDRDHKHGSQSDANKSKFRSSSSEYRDDKRRQRKSKYKRRSKEYELDSGDDSSDSEASTPTVIYSRRERHSDKDFHKSKRETTIKSKSRSKKHKSKRASLSDSEKKYNVIVLENGQGYISSSDEDISNRKTIYVRSKSQHAVRLNGKLQRSKDYYSDADTYKTLNDRNIIYVNEEPKEIIVAPRNRLKVQRAPTHVNSINANANVQSENEELFYLVPASYHTMNNPPPSQDNPIFVNQPTATRVVRMSNPAPQNNATQQAYYGNKSNAVYGQEPLYDEYRQPAQQKFYSQHTNHYRHDNRMSENINVNIVTSEDNHIRNLQNNKDYYQNNEHDHSTVTGNSNLTNQIPNACDTGRTPDGESNSSLGHSHTNSDVSQVSTKPESRVNTAERKRALKHLNELSNYNIDVAMGKATLNPPPMTDENLIKKIFNAEFQSQMDDYLRT